jgi:hypothetical protein
VGRVPLAEPGEGQIRIKVKAAGISPTDLALRAGYLKAIPLPANAVLGFEAAGTVDAVGPGVTGTSARTNRSRSARPAMSRADRSRPAFWNPCERTDSHLAVRALSADRQLSSTQLL